MKHLSYIEEANRNFSNLLPINISFFLLVFILVFSSCAIQNPASLSEDKSLKINVKSFELDRFNQLFVVLENNEIVKMDKDGKVLYNYSDNKKGSISILDVSNPLQTLVYYQDLEWIKIFDRTLNITNEVSLFDLSYQSVKVVASANDNNIWIFDEINQQLIKINQRGDVLFKSADMRQVLGEPIYPIRLFELDNHVYLYNGVSDLYLFDYFGNLKEVLKKVRVKSIWSNGNGVSYLNPDNELMTMSYKDGILEEELQKKLPKDIIDYRYSNNREYLQKKGEILIKRKPN